MWSCRCGWGQERGAPATDTRYRCGNDVIPWFLVGGRGRGKGSCGGGCPADTSCWLAGLLDDLWQDGWLVSKWLNGLFHLFSEFKLLLQFGLFSPLVYIPISR